MRHPDGCTCDQPWHHLDRAQRAAASARENELRQIRRNHGKATLHRRKLAESPYTDRMAWSERARLASRKRYARDNADKLAQQLAALDPELWTADARTEIGDHARTIRTLIDRERGR